MDFKVVLNVTVFSSQISTQKSCHLIAKWILKGKNLRVVLQVQFVLVTIRISL